MVAPWPPSLTFSGPRSPDDDESADLLSAMAGALDVRSIFARLSEIVHRLIPHDRLELARCDETGDSVLARATRATPDAGSLGREHALRARTSTGRQEYELRFWSRRPNAYGPEHQARAQRVVEHLALTVAHEELARAERDGTSVRARIERPDDRPRLGSQAVEFAGVGAVVGQSEEWRRVMSQATRVAATDITVFLQGESGTGKEVVARYIHQASDRRRHPFVAINCAALPEQLLESELFGYERGAFTGANQSKPGLVEMAASGVLFLDEVSEMTPVAQAKFLRFLQNREFQRLGGTRMLKADVRVIAASNRDLREAVELGEFRQDLYYRLQVFDIQLPPLRERADDIPLLAETFLRSRGRQSGRPNLRLSPDAEAMVVEYDWPGNVRELQNVLERAAVLADDDVIEPTHLSLREAPISRGKRADLASVERQAIENVLRGVDWNKSRAAKALGITRTQLYFRLRKYQLEAPAN